MHNGDGNGLRSPRRRVNYCCLQAADTDLRNRVRRIQGLSGLMPWRKLAGTTPGRRVASTGTRIPLWSATQRLVRVPWTNRRKPVASEPPGSDHSGSGGSRFRGLLVPSVEVDLQGLEGLRRHRPWVFGRPVGDGA